MIVDRPIIFPRESDRYVTLTGAAFDPQGMDRAPAECACASDSTSAWADFATVAGVLALLMQLFKG